MALPTSGALTLLDIANEMGGTTPHSLSEYYRGGGLTKDVGANSAVPTSGQISITDFYGADNYIGGLMADVNWSAVGISASGGSGSRSNNTSVTLPAGTRTVFFVGATLDNGGQTVNFSSFSISGYGTATRRANKSDGGEYTSNVGIFDLNLGSTLTSDTPATVTCNMSNSGGASGSASAWMFVSELSYISSSTITGNAGGVSSNMQLYNRGLVFGVGQSGSGGGSTGGAFNTYVNNPYPGVDGSWGSYSRGFGYFVPPVTTTTNVSVSASTDNYAQAVAATSYELG